MDNEQTVIAPDGATRIKIDGYLTELKLANALQQLTRDHWLGNQVPVGDTRQRWDMAYRIGGTVTVVEYDGDEQYRHSIKIKADRAKDEIARSQGHRLVRFPYWVQLDNFIRAELRAAIQAHRSHSLLPWKDAPIIAIAGKPKTFRLKSDLIGDLTSLGLGPGRCDISGLGRFRA